MNRAVFVLTTSILIAWLNPAHAFGKTGHEIVCEIAFQELTSNARAAVVTLIDLDGPGSTFSKACNWADEARQKRLRRPEHFINVPRYYYEVRTGSCRLGDRCLFSAIRHDTDVLLYSEDDRKRLEALKYLGHWVGDIHQPLHVSYADDWGGNKIGSPASGPCRFRDRNRNWQGANLHAVWDTCIIRETLGSDVRTIARDLLNSVEDWQREAWNDSTTVDWADESYDIARRPEVGYCIRENNTCWYGTDNRRLDSGENQRLVTVDQGYVAEFERVVQRRLTQAGVRLGGMLNRIFDPPIYD